MRRERSMGDGRSSYPGVPATAREETYGGEAETSGVGCLSAAKDKVGGAGNRIANCCNIADCDAGGCGGADVFGFLEVTVDVMIG